MPHALPPGTQPLKATTPATLGAQRRGWLRHTAWAGAAWAMGGASALLSGCATPALPTNTTRPLPLRLHDLGPMDVLLLGEQHDAPDHQRLQHRTLAVLLEWQQLGAVVLEMADAGHDTRHLSTRATEAEVMQALAWRDSAWPWAAYGPAVMQAVRAGTPVLGGNRPNADNRALMADAQWDARVPPSVLQSLRSAVDEGHCRLLPEAQLTPMTRVQVARDQRMAHTLAASVQSGRTSVLLCGSQHAHRALGVPLHLPAHLRAKTVRLAADGPRSGDASGFDAVWPTARVPPKDHCQDLAGQWPQPPQRRAP